MTAVTAEVTGGDWAAFRLADDLGGSGALGSAAFVAYTIGMAGFRFGGDALQARIGRTALHRWSVAIASTGLVLAALVPQRWISVAGFGVVGAGVATFMPKLYDDAARIPGRRGEGLGAMTAGTRLAVMITPVVVGAIAGTSWSVGAAIAVVALPSVVAFVVVTEAAQRSLARRGAADGATLRQRT